MAATSTPPISSLVAKLCTTYPDLSFIRLDDLAWSPDEQAVHYCPDSSPSELLHEVGHALLGHRSFARDITLLEMERDAWQRARQLADELGCAIDDSIATAHLDSYRDWLHARSTCPTCRETGIEVARRHYRCLSCDTQWHVNDARRCALRRYVIA